MDSLLRRRWWGGRKVFVMVVVGRGQYFHFLDRKNYCQRLCENLPRVCVLPRGLPHVVSPIPPSFHVPFAVWPPQPVSKPQLRFRPYDDPTPRQRVVLPAAQYAWPLPLQLSVVRTDGIIDIYICLILLSFNILFVQPLFVVVVVPFRPNVQLRPFFDCALFSCDAFVGWTHRCCYSTISISNVFCGRRREAV